MSLASQLSSLATRIATEIKTVRTEFSITAKSAVVTPALTDTFMVDQAGTLRKETVSQLRTLLGTLGFSRCTRVNSTHSISSTTATKVTDLDQTLEAGTYSFTYSLLIRSATTSVSPMLGVNFTGTGNPRMIFYFADASTGLAAELHTMDDQGVLGFGAIHGMANSAKTTTAPNMGSSATLAVATANTDILVFIQGIVIVTVSGDLQLWHSSETATATSVEIGSSLVVNRTA